MKLKKQSGVIRAKHYDKTVKSLMKDEIVIDMADSVFSDMKLCPKEFHGEDYTPTFWFMGVCNDEYARRNGKIKAHIGGVAEAIIQINTE